MKSARALSAIGMAMAAALVITACGSSGSNTATNGGSPGAAGGNGNGQALTVLIASSGPAETNAVTKAVNAWSQKTGTHASVQNASSIDTQLAQGFAGGSPADVFYQGTATLATYSAAGNLFAYGDQLPDKSAFYPSLTAAFTVNGQLQCAPKDFSTLGLVINKKLWDAAGMTNADLPKTWADLATLAQKLTTGGHVGLEVLPQIERLGAVFAAYGGGLEDSSGNATANSAQNVQALTFIKQMLTDGSMKFTTDLGDNDGGVAIGTGHAVMTIEGNWVSGEMKQSYPNVPYFSAELPAGPTGKHGTLAFTNCWGIAADSGNQQGALSLVKYLTEPQQQVSFANAFGVLPPVMSAAKQWVQKNPDFEPFINGAAYAQTLPSQPGTADVLSTFDGVLPQLKSSDPQQLLDTLQKNLQQAIASNQ